MDEVVDAKQSVAHHLHVVCFSHFVPKDLRLLVVTHRQTKRSVSLAKPGAGMCNVEFVLQGAC